MSAAPVCHISCERATLINQSLYLYSTLIRISTTIFASNHVLGYIYTTSEHITNW